MDIAFVRVYKLQDASGTKTDPKPVASVEYDLMGNRAGAQQGGTLMATTDGGKTRSDVTAKVIAGNLKTQDINDVFYGAKKDCYLITVSPDSYSAPKAPKIFLSANTRCKY